MRKWNSIGTSLCQLTQLLWSHNLAVSRLLKAGWLLPWASWRWRLALAVSLWSLEAGYYRKSLNIAGCFLPRVFEPGGWLLSWVYKRCRLALAAWVLRSWRLALAVGLWSLKVASYRWDFERCRLAIIVSLWTFQVGSCRESSNFSGWLLSWVFERCRLALAVSPPTLETGSCRESLNFAGWLLLWVLRLFKLALAVRLWTLEGGSCRNFPIQLRVHLLRYYVLTKYYSTPILKSHLSAKIHNFFSLFLYWRDAIRRSNTSFVLRHIIARDMQ
jgi:hypothetical protein